MPTDTLDSTFAALADPTRRAILARLASGGEASVKELAEPFEMTLPAVSKHLKVFEAWTEPEHFVRWWGPKGYNTPFCTIDLRPGGVMRHCVRSPEDREGRRSGSGQHGFVNGGARETAGVCKRRVRVKEID